MKHSPQVSVIAPYAGGNTLVYFLQSIIDQTFDPGLFELLLIGDGNHDCAKTLNSLNPRFPARVIPLNRPHAFIGHAAGLCRNLGARFAQGAILVFVDSDCVLHPNCLQSHFEIVNRMQHLAVGGAARELPAYSKELLLGQPGVSYQELSQSSLPDYRSEAADEITPPTGDGWDDWYSVNASVAREDFLRVGGFSELGYRCHDLELAYRLHRSGVRFEYSAGPEVIHIEHPRSINFRKEQMKGLLNLGERHPEVKAFVEDHLIVYQRLFLKTIERCEDRFQQLVQNLPGLRIGCSWLLPPGHTEEELAPHLDYIPYVVQDCGDLRYLSLRLHKNCWDYSIILPRTNAADQPSISVIVPVYNAEDTIGRAIESVLLQTSQSFELIIIDDASTGGSLRATLPYQSDPRVRIFSLRHNQGLSRCLNAALLNARASLVVQLDADDWLEPNALEVIQKTFSTDASIGATYGDPIVHEGPDEPTIVEGKQLSTPIEFLECTVPQVPRAYRKSALMSVGAWSTADAFFGRYFDDRLILAKIAEKHRVVRLLENVYHIDERDSSLSRRVPLNFMAGKLAILWDQANNKGYSLSYSFNGKYLRAKLQPRSSAGVRQSWSVIIPFHRSVDELTHSVKSWLESDFVACEGEIVIVDDASGENLDGIVNLDRRIRVICEPVSRGPARARNAGAAAARHEMLFFSDADHIVPPDVLSSHEQRHASSRKGALVVGGVFGRRTFSSIDPDCRLLHKQRLLELLRFDERFEDIAGKLACGKKATLISTESKQRIWEEAKSLSIADPWYGSWAKIFLSHGENLETYAHRWTRVNSGSLSLKAEVFRSLGGFDEQLFSMEDWELGARAQKMNLEIVVAPEAEPYHQIHPVDPNRNANDEIAASTILSKHRTLVTNLLRSKDNVAPPAARAIESALQRTDADNSYDYNGNSVAPDNAGGYCALTFDDGPHPLGTSMILELLERFEAKVTFFFLGVEISKYRDLACEATKLGHEIGIHGWTHSAVEQLTTAENLNMLRRAVDVVQAATGLEVRFARPPYGRLSETFMVAAHKLGLTVVGWDASSDDWLALSKSDILINLAAQGVKDKVVLFHDAAGDPTITIEALDWLVAACANSGIKPVTLTEYSKCRSLPALTPMDIGRWKAII